MKVYLGLGSNLGDRRARLEQAGRRLAARLGKINASPIFETAALTLENSPPEWNKPFLNAALAGEWDGRARDLLRFVKEVEAEVGRSPGERWAPREIDVDILDFASGLQIDAPELRVPHPEMNRRQFVLSPLKHLRRTDALVHSRALTAPLPAWMGILNVTPDSFAGSDPDLSRVQAKVEHWHAHNVQMIDVGAESTRPGATPLGPAEEWPRLEPVLQWLRARFAGELFRPWISVDTRHAETAERALAAGADIINDVSGMSDTRMVDVLRASNCHYVLMHSLCVPADPQVVLALDEDPVCAVKAWAEARLTRLAAAGVDLARVIFDPGIGFGKTAAQSLELLRRNGEFASLGVRLLIGHSRKSFQRVWGDRSAADREWESTGISIRLAEAGVDILRVHEPVGHARAHRAFQEVGGHGLHT